ncbi:MAG TPA: tRNA (adenosine(37)-N6)-threonylcarbamoyltransferase complex transferase subunit TsaD [Myxococcota bacterium]|nr:tRNA (adenosine(37)-N6)-threonylcarbamoyltransferase complex transferase subunit TsaD [Myxococcota bacterium]
MSSPPTWVLGVESSCDEMAAAVVRDGVEIAASVVEGQDAVHRPYGGVVPELASRDHVRAVHQVVERALDDAKIPAEELDGIAVTAGPGLVGSLLVGLSFGKALAYRLGIPLVGVHHLSGHLASAELADPALRPPYLGLVVSGGHTALYRIGAEGEPALLGETRDDAVGEAFDKVAALLGLGFPGGPAVARAAVGGDPDAFALPRPLVDQPGFDFSYSGLKTAVATLVERRGALGDAERADVAASFERAAVAVLVERARRAVREVGLHWIAVVGGVAANRRLRAELAAAGERDGFSAVFPPAALCTDNAAMIAAAGARLLARGERHGLALNAFSRAPVGAAPWQGGRGPTRTASFAQRAEGERRRSEQATPNEEP